MDEKRLLKLADFADNPELVQYETILDIQHEVQEVPSFIEKMVNNLYEAIGVKIASIEKPQNYSDKLDMIMAKLNEPEEDIKVTLNIR